MRTAVCLLLALTGFVGAVDRTKFRRCSDTGFCRNHREKADRDSVYSLHGPSLAFADTHLDADVTHSKGDANLHLRIEFYENGAARIRLTEAAARWQPTEVLLEAGMVPTKAERLGAADARLPSALKVAGKGIEIFSYGTGSVLAVHENPLKFDLYYEDVLQFTANSEAFLHFEQKIATGASDAALDAAAASAEDRHGGKEVLSYGEDGLAIYTDGTHEEKAAEEDAKAVIDTASFTESFGGHKDKRPNGPMSVGIDFVFPSASHVFGIPEHATRFSLHSTKAEEGGESPHYKEPYRMYNLDVFEYELDEPMALYGHIPMMMGHGLVEPASGGPAEPFTAGVFWFNPSETFIDVFETPAGAGKKTHWVSESGNVDFFVFPGPSPAAVYSQYTALTGRQQLPPMFSLGYHQCRWNYRDQKDVAAVEGMFEELDYPVDVIWLDIEHTDGKRYFTWDHKAFPSPMDMQQSLSAHGRKMVTIVDPHIKRDDKFPVHKEATEQGLYIKNSEGKDFDGWCWPGSSSYLDFTDERVRLWWADRFSLTNYAGSTLDLFTWNDMNEPSVFNGPEVSMNKDAMNLAGVEHREWHNLYGMYMQNATSLGLTIRDPRAKSKHMPRPFVLSRAFWSGSQRFGAMWTGDNMANWESLKIASPMLLSIGR
jgi:alpha 1,3-glucosidase